MASATAAAAEAIGLGPAHDEASYVSPHARNKITYKLMHMGEGRCNTLIDDYNMCIKGKTLGQLLCKGQYQASQDCMHRYMNDSNVEMVARRWISLDRPRKPDWGVLLAGILENGDRLGGLAASKA